MLAVAGLLRRNVPQRRGTACRFPQQYLDEYNFPVRFLRPVSVLCIPLLALSLAACGSGEPEAAPATPEITRSEKPDPEQTRKADAEQPKTRSPLPGCEQILTLDAANQVMGSSAGIIFDGQTDGTAWLERNTRIGPAARAAFEGAIGMVSCTWYFENSDNFLYFTVADLPDDVRDDFLAALRASDYVESEISGVPAFTYDDGARGIGVGPIQFAFVDSVLFHTEMPDERRPAIIGHLRQALAGG